MRTLKPSIHTSVAATCAVLLGVTLAYQADVAPAKAADYVFTNGKVRHRDGL